MSTLIERLPQRIADLEAKHGSDDLYVKDLKEQLRAMKANAGKTTQDVYRMQAVKFEPESSTANEMPQDPAIGAIRAMEQRFGKPSTTEDKPD